MDTTQIKEKVDQLCRPVVAGLGFDLILVEWGTQQGRSVLRLYVDRFDQSSGTGVTLDDCATISRQVSAVLDVEDPIHRAYSLEVSSPGIDRPLTRPDHFKRFAGQPARLRLKKKNRQGRRKFQGIIRGADDATVTLEVDGQELTFDLESLDRVNLVGEF